ncbi:S-adenosyl-L-methionine-dependent methyltransferase [Amanita rubescens]|nr:S-adenosyl-L-methionine-dependent methyltransferase [Amanita rubescens]
MAHPDFGSKEYWNQRYAEESASDAHFDWFKSYADLASYLHDLIPLRSSRILVLGCGNSKLSEEVMWDDGYKNIVNIDYSSVVIEQLRQRHEIIRPEMEWLEMDIRDLKFEDGAFDVVIDKGTMDAMIKGSLWDPPASVVEDCTKEVDEAIRVLRKDGVFIYLSFGQPHFRKRYLTRPGTTLEIKQLGEEFHYYLYIVRS